MENNSQQENEIRIVEGEGFVMFYRPPLIPPINNRVNRVRGSYNGTNEETRRIIMWMYRNNVSKAAISRNLGIAESTVRNVINRHSENFQNFTESRGGARNIRCTNEMRQHFDDILSTNCTATLKSLQLSTMEKFGIRLSLATIQRNLKNINLFFKQTSVLPGQRNSTQSIEARYSTQ